MIEYYGWLNISESLDGENEDNLLSIIEIIKSKFPEELKRSRMLELKAINGDYVLNCAGISNRRNSEIDFVLSLFQDIPKIAIGTYGLLYVRDSELNHFDVYKIARGEIIKLKDTLLTPCNPEIEEDISC
jgi:hypothetical protein